MSSLVFASDTPGLCFRIPTSNGTDSCRIEIALALQRCVLSEGIKVVGVCPENCIIMLYRAKIFYEIFSWRRFHNDL